MESSAEAPHVGGLIILDAAGTARRAEGGAVAFGYDRLLQLLDERLASAPRYRQRPCTLPGWAGRLTAPVWADDGAFDLTYHVRRCTLPRAGGGVDQLLEFAGRVLSRPLAPHRPPWEMYLVQGLHDGVAAIVTKAHPALNAGPGGADPAALLLDPTPEPRRTVAPIWAPAAEPGVLDLLRQAVLPLSPSGLGAPAAVGRMAVGRVATAVYGLAGGVATGAFGAVVEAAGGSPAWPLRGRLGDRRRVAVARTAVAGLEQVADEFGGTVHELVPAVVAGALRGWLLSRGVVLGAGTSVRALDGAHAIDLPVGEPDPLLRLAQVRHATRSARQPAGGGERSMPRRAPEVTLTRGAQVSGRRYAAGAPACGLYALPPVTDGRLLSIGVTEYDGSLHYGLSGDWTAIRDLDLVAQLVEQSSAELVDAVAARADLRTGS